MAIPSPMLPGPSTHLRNPLEQDWFMAWTLREAERAHCLGTLILVRDEEVVQAFMANVLKEPFAVTRLVMVFFKQDYHGFGNKTERYTGPRRRERLTYMYGPGSPFRALKQRHVSSTRTGPPI